MEHVAVRRLGTDELRRLTELFEYRDVEAMIEDNTRRIINGDIDIFVLLQNGILAGELRVMYTGEDEKMTVRGSRAYLYAFRIRKELQGKGLGKVLLTQVLDILVQAGYKEATIGVEDDNTRAIHMYDHFGFREVIARKQEQYQGSSYEYNLYLKSLSEKC